MESTTIALLLFALVTVFLGSGIWIFAGLAMVGVSSLYLILQFDPARIGNLTVNIISSKAISWELAAVPMFIWMGDIIFRTDISVRLFRGLSPLVSRVPGGLLHTNIFGCTMFAAISGSSNATTATVGRMTVPELIKRGYDLDLASGSLAGAGTFGLLIPPSIAMIIYGVLAEVSIVELFTAGIIPGLMMAALFSGYIAIVSIIRPNVRPQDEKANLRQMFWGLLTFFPSSF